MSETRDKRKDRYEAVLRTVGYQTSPVQPPGVPPTTVRLILASHGHYTVEGVTTSIRAAVEWRDLFEWRDEESRHRLTCMKASDLRRAATYLATEVESKKQVGRANRALATVLSNDE